MLGQVMSTLYPMKKLLIILVSLLVLGCPTVNAYDIQGEYVTKPGIFPGLKDDGSGEHESRMAYMTWKLKITKDNIIFYVHNDPEGTIMTYEVVGNFILCKNTESEVIKYEPLYIQHDGTLHGMMTIFYKN